MDDDRLYVENILSTLDAEEQVYKLIKDGINNGHFQQGQKLLSERALSKELSLPRVAIRRAFARLHTEHLIERGIGRAGSRVSIKIDKQKDHRAASPQDILEARWAFEPGLVPLIVARATEDDFQSMSEKLVLMEIASTQQEFRESGYAFHLELAKATRNPLLIDIFELIIESRVRAGWGKLSLLNSTVELRNSQIERNKNILEALKNRDSELASNLIRSHLEMILSDVIIL